MRPRALSARAMRRAVTAAVEPDARNARGGGWGGTPPTSLDTQGGLLLIGPKSRGSVGRMPTRAPRRYARRHALGRGSKLGWRPWVAAVGAELGARGHADLAHALRSCGATARVRPCDSCGDPCASVEVRASCCLRVCPWCARLDARDRVALVSGAIERVEGYQRAQQPAALARVEADRAEAARVVAHWSTFAAAARASGRVDVAARHDARAHAAAAREALARRERAAVRELPRWRWKLVTISLAWSPRDAREYTPERLRQRVAAVVDAWRRAWEAGARAGGLAAATVRVELSSRGHVHAHVLYRGPYVPQAWWARVCGGIVDVRAIDDRGVVEALKYTLKMPTPGRSEWIAGQGRDAPHPRLAAAWLVATRRAQLVRHHGVMRDAIAAEQAAAPSDPPERPEACGCASCGADLTGVEAVMVPTAGVARYLGPRWGATSGVDLWGRALPRRVTLARAPW